MKLQINQDWRITTDSHNFILEKSRVAGKGEHRGEIVWSQESFYSTFESALEGLIRHETLLCQAESVIELKSLLSRLSEQIDACVKGAGLCPPTKKE